MYFRKSLTIALFTTLTIQLFGQLDLRQAEPIVLKGEVLPTLIDIAVDEIVGFKIQDGEWEQVPIQIDEMDWRLAYDIYNQQINNNFELDFLVYTDLGKYTGPDTDPNFDKDDEFVFMAKDAGEKFTGQAWPSNTMGAPVEVRIYDPLIDQYSFVYLFAQDGTLDPSVGEDYVSYEYELEAGEFIENYVINYYNPENSIVQTDYYSQRYLDDWIRDVIKISAGNANNADILDRAKVLLAPGQCNRSIDTYSAGSGVHIASKDGAVRGIRSIMGANSGPLIERNHYFYEQMDVLETWVRLHFVRGFLRFLDFSNQASGMTLYDEYHMDGVAMDGQQEDFDEWDVSDWALFTGDQGSLLLFDEINTTFPADTFLTYYLDDVTPGDNQCTGDNKSIGAYGHWLKQEIPDTDPRSGSEEVHFYRETSHFLPENLTPDDIYGYRQQHHKALEVEIFETPSTSTDNIVEQVNFKLYPNPTRGVFQIQFPDSYGPTQVIIRALDGRVIWQDIITADQEIALPSGLNAGIYLVEMQSEVAFGVEKLIVQ